MTLFRRFRGRDTSNAPHDDEDKRRAQMLVLVLVYSVAAGTLVLILLR